MTFMHQRSWPQTDVELVHTNTVMHSGFAWGQRISRTASAGSHSIENMKNYYFCRRDYFRKVRVSLTEDGSWFIARAINEFQCGIEDTSPTKDELPQRPRPFLSTTRRVAAYSIVRMHNQQWPSIVARINRNTADSRAVGLGDINVHSYATDKLRITLLSLITSC